MRSFCPEIPRTPKSQPATSCFMISFLPSLPNFTAILLALSTVNCCRVFLFGFHTQRLPSATSSFLACFHRPTFPTFCLSTHLPSQRRCSHSRQMLAPASQQLAVFPVSAPVCFPGRNKNRLKQIPSFFGHLPFLKAAVISHLSLHGTHLSLNGTHFSVSPRLPLWPPHIRSYRLTLIFLGLDSSASLSLLVPIL